MFMSYLTREKAESLINTYVKAWEGKEVGLLKELFADDATYVERYYSVRMVGLREIEGYWYTKVICQQENIHVVIKNIWINDNLLIVEWEAVFDDLVERVHRKMYEIAVIEIGASGLITHLREFWDSVVLHTI